MRVSSSSEEPSDESIETDSSEVLPPLSFEGRPFGIASGSAVVHMRAGANGAAHIYSFLYIYICMYVRIIFKYLRV